MTSSQRVLYRLACWWLDSPRVDRVRRYVERKAAR